MCLRRSFLPVARVGSRSHVGPCVPRRALRSTLGPTVHAGPYGPSRALRLTRRRFFLPQCIFLTAVHVEPDRGSFVVSIGLRSSLGLPYNEKVTALRNQPLPSHARFAVIPCRTEPRRGIRSRREIPHAPPARGIGAGRCGAGALTQADSVQDIVAFGAAWAAGTSGEKRLSRIPGCPEVLERIAA